MERLVGLLAEALNVLPSVQHLPPEPGNVPRSWADISRGRATLGFEPKMPIEEGLPQTSSLGVAHRL